MRNGPQLVMAYVIRRQKNFSMKTSFQLEELGRLPVKFPFHVQIFLSAYELHRVGVKALTNPSFPPGHPRLWRLRTVALIDDEGRKTACISDPPWRLGKKDTQGQNTNGYDSGDKLATGG